MNKNLIFIGSTHGFIDDFLKQKEIIDSINPEFVLAEELEDLKLDSKEKFKEFFQNKIVSNMTSFNEVEKLARLCFNKNIKLIGIDFPNFGFNINLQKKIKNQEEISAKDEEEIIKIVHKREKKHLKEILNYSKKTKLPLVIILGSWHLKDGSLLRRNLNNYRLILPCDKEGNLLDSPRCNKEEIQYKEFKNI